MNLPTPTAESAKRFPLSKLEEQALNDGVSLSDIEKRMFVFSEVGNSAPDFEANEKFAAEYDDQKYEIKIARLLRRSYARDKKSDDGRRSWTEALDALRNDDFYGLVMVDLAGIPHSGQSPSSAGGVWRFMLDVVPLALAELAIIAIGIVAVFHPEVAHLALPDWLRLLLLPAFFYLMWLTGEIFKRRIMK